MISQKGRALVSAIAAASMLAATAVLPAPAYAKGDKQDLTIPHCVRPLGTAAVKLPPDGTDWWSGLQLSSPETLVKTLVKESNCFTLLDRGSAMQLADEERARAQKGDLRANSNIGRGQVKAADYIIVPTVMNRSNNAGGFNVGGILGTVIGGTIGALVSGLNIKKKTADVHLEVVDVRSSEVVASADGHSKKNDISFGGGAGLAGWNGLGAFGASSYANTDIGKVVMAAYIQAYRQIVLQRGGVLSLPETAGSTSPRAPDPVIASPQASFIVTRASSFRGGPSTSASILRTLSAQTIVYPTGETSGSWRKVTTEDGATGWISSLSLRAN